MPAPRRGARSRDALSAALPEISSSWVSCDAGIGARECSKKYLFYGCCLRRGAPHNRASVGSRPARPDPKSPAPGRSVCYSTHLRDGVSARKWRRYFSMTRRCATADSGRTSHYPSNKLSSPSGWRIFGIHYIDMRLTRPEGRRFLHAPNRLKLGQSALGGLRPVRKDGRCETDSNLKALLDAGTPGGQELGLPCDRGAVSGTLGGTPGSRSRALPT